MSDGADRSHLHSGNLILPSASGLLSRARAMSARPRGWVRDQQSGGVLKTRSVLALLVALWPASQTGASVSIGFIACGAPLGRPVLEVQLRELVDGAEYAVSVRIQAAGHSTNGVVGIVGPPQISTGSLKAVSRHQVVALEISSMFSRPAIELCSLHVYVFDAALGDLNHEDALLDYKAFYNVKLETFCHAALETARKDWRDMFDDLTHALPEYDDAKPAGNAHTHFAVATRELLPDNVTVHEQLQLWPARHTAILVIDMWQMHPCEPAMRRQDLIISRMNATIAAARARGALIIHAPAHGVEEMTAQYPVQREKIRRASISCAPGSPCFARAFGDQPPPAVLERLMHEPDLPVPTGHAKDVWPVHRRGLCDNDVVMPDGGVRFPTHRQHPGIHISVGDGLSESAQEILGAFVQNDIRHVVVMGMAANMCLLVRPFGLRLLSRFAQRESAGEKEARDGPGKLPRWQVVVARDLTDIMYDPRNPPYLTHAKAKALVLRHIERYICASIHSSHLFPPPP